MKKIILVLLVLTMLLLTGCGQYSSGERAGEITKFSKKGLIWKTWEGEMNLGGMRATDSGAVSNLFQFSLDNSNKYNVDNNQMITEIQFCMSTGRRCRLHYEQEVLTAPWRADTQYIITKVDILGDEPNGNYVDVEGGRFNVVVE